MTRKRPDTLTMAAAAPPPCPCGSGQRYTSCCEPLHAGALAADAAALMRSRYAAYVMRLEPYLLATWHASTRPASLGLAREATPPKWLGLEVRRHQRTDNTHAMVEFVARFKVGGGSAQRLHEISRFVQEDGRWYYLDGEFPTTA
ncbi:YchJ family protein [Tahibacter amnicola]|uniref:UPF0225 protein N4264_02625 n=1 Tax=Tahibacter amnicola TaxID=2976241 RepID=A0ABY6BEW0_9GAMM|nr:YchJ family metal-binding protein [Tahibacter amnicola]UXI68568.1 YchJ family metal-binding protein [Tahibacter amnicola]